MKKLKIPCEIYSRTVGYYRPISQWNKGKQEEFKDRKYLKIGEGSSSRFYIDKKGERHEL